MQVSIVLSLLAIWETLPRMLSFKTRLAKSAPSLALLPARAHLHSQYSHDLSIVRDRPAFDKCTVTESVQGPEYTGSVGLTLQALAVCTSRFPKEELFISLFEGLEN